MYGSIEDGDINSVKNTTVTFFHFFTICKSNVNRDTREWNFTEMKIWEPWIQETPQCNHNII